MKALFLLLNLLTEGDAIRNVLHSCFTAALVSVGVFVLLGAYQVFRRWHSHRNTGTVWRA
jgi:hypothetical protein